MQATLNRVLFLIATTAVAADAVWLAAGHFAIDARAYGLLALLLPPLVAASAWYRRARGEAGISAAFGVAAFLIVFPAASSLMSYLLFTIAGPRIDTALAAADHSLGFDWPSMMALAAGHPLANSLLGFAYVSVMPQTLILLLLLGYRSDLANLYGLALALAFGAVITLAVWTAFPSFGAFSVFNLPAPVASKLGLVLGFDYARDLVAMLKDGPAYISPRELRGVVGFPSYHTLQALLLAWYARRLPFWRWVGLGLNAMVLLAVPIHGGHHLVDMLGGLAATMLAIVLAGATVAWAGRPAGAEAAMTPALSPR